MGLYGSVRARYPNVDSTHYVKILWQGSIGYSGTSSIPGIRSDRLIYIKFASTGTLAPIVTSAESQRFGVAEPQELNYKFNGCYVRLDGESLVFSEVLYSVWRYNALGQWPTCIAGDAALVTAARLPPDTKCFRIPIWWSSILHYRLYLEY